MITTLLFGTFYVRCPDATYICHFSRRPKVDADKSPDDGLMDMLKNMYDDGDDDMKRTISKAWSEREKNGSPGDPM